MLRTNLDVPDCLVNGACGYIDSITATDEGEVTTIYTKFDGDAGQRWCTLHGTPSVGIYPHTVRFMGKDGKRVRRRQFPVVFAWAKTIHKSQGATEHKGVKATLDKKVRMPGQAYVALSRSPSSELVSLTAFDPGCFSTMAGIEWALNELYIQQSEAKPPTTRGNADILAEMVLRPPHPPEHYRELQRVLQRPDWLVYAKDAAEWQDLPDDFDEQPKRIKCARCGQLVDSTILAQRQHNQRCTGKARRKRQSAGSTTPATTKSTRRKDSSAAATIPSASSRVPSKASTDLVVIPAGRRWTCHALEFGTALASSPEWCNPTRSDAVAQNRTQIGASCGFLAALHLLAGLNIEPDDFNIESFRILGRAREQETDNFTFHTIGDFLGYYQVGLDTVTTDGTSAVARPTTAGFLLLFPYGTISRHWISGRRDGAGGWLLCDSLHPSPFQVAVRPSTPKVSTKTAVPLAPSKRGNPLVPVRPAHHASFESGQSRRGRCHHRLVLEQSHRPCRQCMGCMGSLPTVTEEGRQVRPAMWPGAKGTRAL